jgi:hypothetical protein
MPAIMKIRAHGPLLLRFMFVLSSYSSCSFANERRFDVGQQSSFASTQ